MSHSGGTPAVLVPTLALSFIVVLLFAYVFAVRPWHTAWGATHVDRVVRLPGDELSPRAYHTVTHAVNIDADPQFVWPWIVQVGQDRSGFYSYRFLENLVGCEMPEVHRVVPEWQNRAVGDTVWFATPKHFRGRARMVVAQLRPERAMTLASPEDWKRFQAGDEGLDTTWTFALIPKLACDRPGHTTRLIARTRSVAYPTIATQFLNYIFWEPLHFIMERKMLLTIAGLAERSRTAR
jgi:hypothetical protein